MLAAVACLFLVQLSTPIVAPFSLVHFSVTDGNVKGTLSLGTYGYCLSMPNHDGACSHAHFLYKIGQYFNFFFQPSHFITSSYLLRCHCNFKDNPQIFARVDSKTRIFSIAKVAAFVLAFFGYIFSAIEWTTAAEALALLSAVFAAVGLVIEELFTMATAGLRIHTAGPAFCMTLFAISGLGGFYKISLRKKVRS